MLTLISSQTSIILSTDTFAGTFRPLQSYVREVEYFISPNMQPGLYNLTVHTDYNNRVFEFLYDNNNILWKSVQFDLKLSDLKTLPDSVTVVTAKSIKGNTLLVNYSVVNQGEGPAIGTPWTDRIALSVTSDFEERSSHFLARHIQRKHSIVSGNNYTVHNLMINLPGTLFGNIYIHILLDYDGQVTEEQETNNIYTKGPISILPVLPNLTVVSFDYEGGSEAYSGSMLTLRWKVSNRGNGLINNKYWFDGIYLSSMPTKINTSIKLDQVKNSMRVSPGQSYNQNLTVLIPDGVFGEYFVILITDIFGNLESNSATSAIAVYLSIPPTPDLQVQELSYNRHLTTLTVTWTVANRGNSMIKKDTWIDAVFLTKKMDVDSMSAIHLGHFLVEAQLITLQQYTLSRTVALPSTAPGKYYLFIQCDRFDDVLEVHGEDNNYATAIMMIEHPRLPDLQVELISDLPSSTLFAGQGLAIEYKIVNRGRMRLSRASWIDGIYLYSTLNADRVAVLAGGILLKEILHNEQLEIGGEVIISTNTTIPYGIYQIFYVYIIVDVNNKLDILYSNISTIPFTYGTVPVAIEPGELSDLTIIVPADELVLHSGTPHNLAFSVRNLGNGSADRVWYDAVFLSFDAYLDPFDVKLKSKLRKIALASNESYSQTAEVFIPYDLSYPEYYLIYQVDVRNHIGESDKENNIVSKLVSLKPLVSTDISVTETSVSPQIVTYGQGEGLCTIQNSKYYKKGSHMGKLCSYVTLP